MNKILKSFKTNGHTNGELEVTFMREFQRSVRHRDFVSSISQMGDLTGRVAGMLLASEKDIRGTIASMAQEIDEAAADGESFILYILLRIDNLLLIYKHTKHVVSEAELTSLKGWIKRCRLIF